MAPATAQRIGRLAFGLTIPCNADTPAAVAGTVDKQKVGRLFPRRFRPDHELPAPMACCFSPADCVRILAIPLAHVQPGGVDAWPAATFHRPGAGLCTDSRQLRPGAVFVALRGEHSDGHSYLAHAARSGAVAAIVAEGARDAVAATAAGTAEGPAMPLLPVPDPLQAYQDLARAWRRQWAKPLVAVTGSAGKTTTRELIRAALAPLGTIHGTAANENNDVGLPRTVLAAGEDAAAIVVEMGMRGPGEIERLSRCAEPDIAVITNIGTAHIGRLGSRAAIAAAKCEITAALAPDGAVVVPAGDALLDAALASRWCGTVLRVALDGDAVPPQLAQADRHGTVTDGALCFNGQRYPLPLPGIHQARNLLTALVCAQQLGAVPTVQQLQQARPALPSGRSQRLELAGGISLWDETYNASPEAVTAALSQVAAQPGRHFAVLGTMLELGDFAEELHRAVALHVEACHFAGLVVVDAGPLGNVMAAAAGDRLPVVQVGTPEAAVEPLLQWLGPGDQVLLKASRGVALERLIPSLTTALSRKLQPQGRART